MGTKTGRVKNQVLRAAAILTTDYVASESVYVADANTLSLEIYFTKGSSTGCELKVEKSYDDDNWVQEAGVIEYPTINQRKYGVMTEVLENAADLEITLPITNVYVRVSARALTSGVGTSLQINLNRTMN